ncbi:MAG: class I tRNA ligase family protein, partial [Candidatus Nanopelagicales bacterium]
MSPRLPDKPSIDGIEQRWVEAWEEQGTYLFDRTRPRDEVFSIDTPPPTVSGSLHVGHVFSYTHEDLLRGMVEWDADFVLKTKGQLSPPDVQDLLDAHPDVFALVEATER